MDSTTEKLIEKYKSEMQKMISNVSRLNIEAEQNLNENTISEFPRFENQNESLKEKIEEILRQNSEVVTTDDYPSDEENIPQNETEVIMAQNNTDEQIAQQNQVQLTASESNNTPAQQGEVSRTCIRGGQKAQYSPPANTGSISGETQNTASPLTDRGFLKIEAFSANRAFPVKNAVIRVKNADNDSLIGVFITNVDGITDVFELATPDRNLSQSAVSQNPFSNYLVDVSAEGYAPVSNINVQMFGGVRSVLPVNLIPQIKR